VRLACYDPGSRHLGEACLEVLDGQRPRCLLAGHVTVDLSDEGLAQLASRLREGWTTAGVERVVLERVSGLGAGPDVPAARVRAIGNALVQAGGVCRFIQALALAMGLPVVTYPPRTVRAGMKAKGKSEAVALVKASVDGWHIEGEAAPEGATGWYNHAYDAALVGLWDIETRARPAPQKGKRAERKPGTGTRVRKLGTKRMRNGHPSDAAFEEFMRARGA
jgi:hypothetical protein